MEFEKIKTNEPIRKIINFEVKEVGEPEERVLQFVGSDETADRDDDIIEVSGWDLKNFKKNPVILFGHDYRSPAVAKAVKVEKDLENKQLVFDVKFPTTDELSSNGIENASEHAKFVDTLYNLYKHGYMKATSVGFIPKKWTRRDDGDQSEKPEYARGVRFMQQELLELSLVPVPANPSALELAKSKGFDVEPVKAAAEKVSKDGQKEPGSNIPFVTVETRTEETEYWKCPHCGEEIGEKELYWDEEKDLWYHRPCQDKGPVLLPADKNNEVGSILQKYGIKLIPDESQAENIDFAKLEELTSRMEAAAQIVTNALAAVTDKTSDDGTDGDGDNPDAEPVLELADEDPGAKEPGDNSEPALELADDEAKNEGVVEVDTLKTMVKGVLQEELTGLKELITAQTGRVF